MVVILLKLIFITKDNTMSIKTIPSKLKAKKVVKNSYPKIMIGKLYTMLFFAKGTGVVLVVHPDAYFGEECYVGEYRVNVPMEYYIDHNEPVTIQNTNKG